MAAGDILKTTGLVVESFLVKTNEDIEKGEIVCDDGAGGGLVAATAALAALNKCYMALEAHDYSEVTEHYIECVVKGYVECQKVTGSGAAQISDKIMMSGTAGEVTKFAPSAVPAADTYNTVAMQAALDTSIGVVGEAMVATLDATTTQKMRLL